MTAEKWRPFPISNPETEPDDQPRKSSRREAFANFEEQRIRYLEKIALVEAELRDLATQNPDATIDDLDHAIEERIGELDISDTDRQYARGIVEKFVTNRDAIQRIRAQYYENDDLFEMLFGGAPMGQIAIDTGPASIHFRCTDPTDYALIVEGDDTDDHHTLTYDQISRAALSEGAFLPYARGPLPAGTITVEIVDSLDDPTPSAVRKHEEQHAWHDLFLHPFTNEDYKKYWESGLSPEEKTDRVTGLARWLREQHAEHELADEVLAYIHDGRANDETILDLLTPRSTTLDAEGNPEHAKTEDDHAYDYLATARQKIINIAAQQPQIDSDSIIKRVFEDELRQVIKNGIVAYRELQKNASLDTKEMAALLNLVPLRHWPKIARRRKKFSGKTELYRRSLKQETPLHEYYECLAQEFDHIGERERNKRLKG